MRPKKILVYIVVAGILITLVSGCSRQTKHKVLTFFFTGVPSLEDVEKVPVKMKQVLSTNAEVVKKNMAEKTKLYSHTPWAAGECNQCHKNAGSFGILGQKGPPTVFRKGGGMPGKLILPKKKLCIKCHEAMSKEKAYFKGLYLHPTSAEGECNACHDPHQSKNPNMLLEKPKIICVSCHLEEEVLDPGESCKKDDCLSCHNPHLGKNRLLLKKDFKEVPQKVIMDRDSARQRGSRSYEPGEKESGID